MYLSHYKLVKRPFDISPNPEFLWLGEKHKEGLATLKYGILQNKGYLMITGDIGTGKTALIRAIERSIKAHIIVVTIPDPSLSLMDFYNVMASELNMGRSFESKGEFLIEFKKYILRAASSHQRVLMIIDESHRLTSELLEEIRLLSNIDLGGKVLINTFFVGQLEFKALLARDENRAVRQRITVNYDLLPLTVDETEQYIGHRLKVAGASRPIFTPEAIRLIHVYSHGYPRLINILCDHALMSGFSSGVDRIDDEIVKECGEELKITIGLSHDEEKKIQPLEPQRKGSGTGSSRAPVPDSSSRRGAVIFAGFLALLGLAWYISGDRISNELARWGKSDELHTLPKSGAPAAAHERPDRPTPLVPDSRVKPEIQDTRTPVQAQEDSIRTKQKTPGAMPSTASPPQAATAVADAEAVAAVPITPQPTVTAIPSLPAPQAAAAPVAVASPPPSNETFRLKEFTVYFAKDSTEIPFRAQDILEITANLLKSFSQARAVIEGHTDSTGEPAVNKEISEGRAASVKDYLVGQGIEPHRLALIGYGPQKPIESNSTPEGRSKNRRVVIRIVADKPR